MSRDEKERAEIEQEMRRLVEVLQRYRYTFFDEKSLQQVLETIFRDQNFCYVAEHTLGPRERIDFYLAESRIGVEVKTRGGLAAVTRQLYRYAGTGQLGGLLCVTTNQRLLALPSSILDIPVAVCGLSLHAFVP